MSINAQLLIAYAVLWVVLVKSLLMRSGIVHAECPRCGNPYERRELGGVICRCRG